MEKKIFVVTLIVLCVSFGVNAMPTIGIAGLDDGQAWTWVEAEYLDASQTTWTNAGLKWCSDPLVSNYNYGSYVNAWNGSPYGTDGTAIVNYNVYLPAAMDSTAKIYLKNGASTSGDRTGFIDIDGSEAASYSLTAYGNAYGANPLAWTVTTATGALSAGSHELDYGRGSDIWNYLDGFYLVEGDITVGTVGTVYNPLPGGSSRKLISAPIAVDSHEINAASVTPTITVAGATSFECYLNGAAYTLGTAITGLGDYALEVYAWDTAGQGTYSHSGVNFTLVPEPSTVILLSIGLGLLRRKK